MESVRRRAKLLKLLHSLFNLNSKRTLALVWLLTFCVSYLVLHSLNFKDTWRSYTRKPFSWGAGPPVLRASECTEQNLKDWVFEMGATSINLTFEDFLNEGLPWDGPKRRGVMTLQDLEADQVVVKVPVALGLSPSHKNKTSISDIFDAHPELDSFFITTLMVLHESLQPESFWWRWLCMLPRELPSPVYWTAEKTATLGRFAIERVEQSRTTLRWYYTDVMLPLQKLHPDRFPKDVYTASRFLWACGIVMSRAWGYPKQLENVTNGFEHLLMPFADMFNHVNSAHGVSFHKVPGYLTLQTAVSTRRGGELYLNYGPKCNLRLLITYGFELAKNEITKCSDELTEKLPSVTSTTMAAAETLQTSPTSPSPSPSLSPSSG